MSKEEPHPCFSCILPDCDDTHKGCALREIDRAYTRARRAGSVPDQLRRQHHHAYKELYHDRAIQRRGHIRDVMKDFA